MSLDNSCNKCGSFMLSGVCMSCDGKGRAAQDSARSNNGSSSIEPSLNPQNIQQTPIKQENISQAEKISIRNLFLSPPEPEKIPDPKLIAATEVLLTNKRLLDAIADGKKDFNPNHAHMVEIQQAAIDINRPAAIVAIANANKLIPSDEIARIELERNESLDRILKSYDSAGPEKDESGTVIKSTYDRKHEYLSKHIHELKVKQAQLRLLEDVAYRKLSNLRTEQTESLSPEERKDFEKRARKAAGSKNPESESHKLAKKAKEDALKSVSKERRAAAKMLQDSGEKAIPACIKFYQMTEEDCLRFLEKGSF